MSNGMSFGFDKRGRGVIFIFIGLVQYDEVDMKKNELMKKTKLELLEMARKADLAGRSNLDKDELVSALALLLKEKKTAPAKRTSGKAASGTKKAALSAKSSSAKKAVPEKKVKTQKVAPEKASTPVKKVPTVKQPAPAKVKAKSKKTVATETKKATITGKSSARKASAASDKTALIKKTVVIKKAAPAKVKDMPKKTAPTKMRTPEEKVLSVKTTSAAETYKEAMPLASPKKPVDLNKVHVDKKTVPVEITKGPIKKRDENIAIAVIPSVTGKTASLQEKVEDTKFYIGAEEKAFVSQTELPTGYNDNKVVLMVRDPHWAYVYWEINSNKVDEARNNLKSVFDQSRLVLRVYDVTGVDFKGSNANSFFDIDIPNVLGNWYVNLGNPNRIYCIDIGYKKPDGDLFVLSHSNKITSPRESFSEVSDETWSTSDEEYKNIYARSEGFGQAGSSVELAEMMKKRLEKEISSGGVRGVEPKEASRKH